jgi:hypothetical protein
MKRLIFIFLLATTPCHAALSNLMLYQMQQSAMIEQTIENMEMEHKLRSIQNGIDELGVGQRGLSIVPEMEPYCNTYNPNLSKEANYRNYLHYQKVGVK